VNGVNVIIVGAGLMGWWHARYARQAGGRVVGVVDRDAVRAAGLARECDGVPCGRDLAEALAGSKSDVVNICTPASSHAELVEKSLVAGRHVLCEKPLALTLAETSRLLTLAGRRGLRLNAVHQFPQQRGFRQLVARRDRLGEAVRIAWRAYSAGGDGRPAAARRAVLLEILPHAASLLHALSCLGDGSEFAVGPFTDDDLLLTARHGQTQIAIEISLRARPTRNELSVVGTRGSATVDLFHGYCLFESGQASRAYKIVRPLRLGAAMVTTAGANLLRRAVSRESAYPGLRELIGRFYRSTLGQGPPPVSDAEMMAAATMIERSAAQATAAPEW
jgi:predicted dehydrogenase